MTPTIVIYPLKGVDVHPPFGHGFLPFGATRDEASEILGNPSTLEEETGVISFHQSQIQATFNDNALDYVEFYTTRDPNTDEPELVIALGDTILTSLDAPEAARFLLTANGDAHVGDAEAPTSYEFHGVGITVWQPSDFETARAEYEEAVQEEEDEDEIEFLRAEMERARHFHTIGCGSEKYMQQYLDL